MASSSKMDANQLARLLGAWSTGSGPLYRQLGDGIVSLIDDGALRHQTRLPPERALATTLSISRSTVVAAYSELKERGQLTRRQGSGTEVVAKHVPGPEHGELRSAPMFDPGTETRALLQAVPRPLIDVAAELRELGSTDSLLGLDDVEPEGMWPLRTAIADRYTAAGLPTGPEQILVTSGTQQACTLLLAELCQPGDVVLCEDYTWPGLTDAAERLGARCHGIPSDEGGLDVSQLRNAIERLRPTAIVVNPHHQNPTGTRMLPHRRRELANVAADYGVMVIEDRVFADLAFDGVVPLPLAAHRPDAPIVVADSLSKTVWSGYRLGWIRASTDLIGRLRYGKALDDLGTSVPSQLLALQVFPRLDALIEARREQLATAAAAMHGLLSEALPDWSLSQPMGGASLWVELPAPVVSAFVRHAARCGVLLIGDDAFAVREPADRHLRMPFTADEAEWTTAIDRLAVAWRSFDPSQGDRSGHRTALV